MGADPMLTSTREFLSQTKFVLVNDRAPRADAHCELCGRKIENGYVRESRTRLLYCDTQCFAGYAKWKWLAVSNPARKVS
jgi:hypothetical protein